VAIYLNRKRVILLCYESKNKKQGGKRKRGEWCWNMETRDIIFSVVMVFSAFVLVYKLVYGGSPKEDPVIVMSAVILIGMLAILFLSVGERLRRMEEAINEKERSLRVSLQSVEEEVRNKVDAATRGLNETRDAIVKRGYR